MSLPEEVVQIPITKLRAFPEHPFYVRDDDMMQQLVESVRQVGVLMPIIVRGSEDGFYEIISGHRRKHACELLELEYEIPPEALNDVRFRNMITEAERYLGYPYVWGGSSPSTSFDCSGFVSWVINNCGNGWSVGRLGADGLRGICTYVSPDQAKPGDLIFFQGTYDTTGASHVGIYVGNGMMIHCGNPIQYTSIESNYWQQHFLCFGRLS